MTEIVQTGDSILRKTADNIPRNKIVSDEIQNLIKDMSKTLSKEEDGVALAAPQVGVPLRLFIVSGKMLQEPEDAKHDFVEDLVFINPKIVKNSREKITIDEGCLSVRGKYGKVKRSAKVTMRALDKKGKVFERGGSGLLAQIFQHETDHLDGILFTDKTTETWDINLNNEKQS